MTRVAVTRIASTALGLITLLIPVYGNFGGSCGTALTTPITHQIALNEIEEAGTAWMESITVAWHEQCVNAAMPRLIIGLIIIVAGWLIAAALRSNTARAQ